MSAVIIKVTGHPRPQPRPRAFRGIIVSTADKNAKLWQKQIQAACAEALIHNNCTRFEKGSALSLKAIFQMPTKVKKRWGKPHTSRPDVDNLLKLAMDQISATDIMPEDSHIWETQAVKIWSEQHGAIFVIEEKETSSVLDRLVEIPSTRPHWLG